MTPPLLGLKMGLINYVKLILTRLKAVFNESSLWGLKDRLNLMCILNLRLRLVLLRLRMFGWGMRQCLNGLLQRWW